MLNHKRNQQQFKMKKIMKKIHIATMFFLLIAVIAIFISDEVSALSYLSSYNTNVIEYSNQTFNITFSYNNSLINYISANLTYNGTTYTPAIETHDNETWNFTVYVDIPPISSTYNETRQFYWTYFVNYTNGTNATFNTSIYNQIIHKIVIMTTPQSGFNAYIFMHSYYDEESIPGATGVSATSKIKFDVYLLENKENISKHRFYSFTQSAGTSHSYYLYPIFARDLPNVRVNVEATLTATNYIQRELAICNRQIYLGQSPQYLLKNNATYTKVYFNLKDANQQNLPDYTISIYRYDRINNISYYLGSRKTDAFGLAVERLLEDYTYRIEVYDHNCNFVREWVFNLVCKEYPCIFELSVSNVTSPYERIEELKDFIYSWNWDKQNKILTLAWEDKNNPTKVESIKLLVFKRKLTREDTLVCENLSLASGGTLVCNLSNFASGNFLAKVIVKTKDGKTFERWYNFAITTAKEIFGKDGLILSLLIILSLFFVGIWNPVVAITLSVVGIILVSILGLASLPFIFVILIITIAIIIIIKIKT